MGRLTEQSEGSEARRAESERSEFLWQLVLDKKFLWQLVLDKKAGIKRIS